MSSDAKNCRDKPTVCTKDILFMRNKWNVKRCSQVLSFMGLKVALNVSPNRKKTWPLLQGGILHWGPTSIDLNVRLERSPGSGPVSVSWHVICCFQNSCCQGGFVIKFQFGSKRWNCFTISMNNNTTADAGFSKSWTTPSSQITWGWGSYFAWLFRTIAWGRS